ncbi:MAG: class I SAM-dependent methyltransferase [Candidatus Eisenbacteria bacterium]
MAIDEKKLDEFLGRVVSDLGAALNTALVLMGDKLGLYKAMAGAGPLTPQELAQRTGTNERSVREWLNGQAAGGYISYDPKTEKYELPEEHAMALTQQDSPAYITPAFSLCTSMLFDEPKVTDAFRTGKGVGWHEHHHTLFEGTEKFFRSTYLGNLISSWIPALDGVEAKLRSGAKVADVGCGHGVSTILMANAFPRSRFIGFDYHGPSIETARQRAQVAGTNGNLNFEVSMAKTFPGKDYDLIAFFDCLHDMGDPVGAAAHAREALAPGGTLMVVEPMAGDRVEDNLNPVGRVYYTASTLVCTQCSLSQEVGAALGAQAGEARLRQVLMDAGFKQVRRAAETPFNMVLEARA